MATLTIERAAQEIRRDMLLHAGFSEWKGWGGLTHEERSGWITLMLAMTERIEAEEGAYPDSFERL